MNATAETVTVTDPLCDRIVDFLAAQTAESRTKWDNPDYYAMGVQVTDIAVALGVSMRAASGALSHLHATRQIVGVCALVGPAADQTPAYLIALRADVG